MHHFVICVVIGFLARWSRLVSHNFCDIYFPKLLCHNPYTSAWVEKIACMHHSWGSKKVHIMFNEAMRAISIRLKLRNLGECQATNFRSLICTCCQRHRQKWRWYNTLIKVTVGYCLFLSFGYSELMPVWILPFLSKFGETGS